jgi:hypothetical protein
MKLLPKPVSRPILLILQFQYFVGAKDVKRNVIFG